MMRILKHAEKVRGLVCSTLLLLLLTGCIAGQEEFKRGKKALQQKQYDVAVSELLDAVEKNPDAQEYRINLNRARSQAALDHKIKGDEYFAQDAYRQAIQEYELAFELDGTLFTAGDGLQKSRDHLKAHSLVEEAQVLLDNKRHAQARDTVARALYFVPDYQPALVLKEQIQKSKFALVDGVELEVTSSEPINLNFQNTKIPDVFDILTRLSGINFILDEDVRDERTTLYLEKATFAQALELLLRMNKLDKKILNSKTIILFPKTRDKQKQFEDQIIQTFYLSHIDAKKAVNLLRTMLQVRKIYVQEELNAIVIRDQPDVIKLAQKMIEATDRGNSEVVFVLELLEVNHSDTRELGLKLSNYSIGAGLSIKGSGQIADSGLSSGGATDNLIELDSSLDPFYSIPTASFRFLKTLVNSEVLANPKIRVRNREKAKVHVGSREPVVTVTINDTQTSENVQYIDVGVKLDIEPTVQLDRTIVTRLGLEVSNVSGREKTANGTAVITISSTNATTTLTLKDGQQTIIGGLIRDDNAVTKSKIPLLGDIPVFGEVFNGTDKSKIKREILLSITPHIVKFVPVPQGDTASIWSGGEDDLKFGRNFGTFAEEFVHAQQGLQPRIEPLDPVKHQDALHNQNARENTTKSMRENTAVSAVREMSSAGLLLTGATRVAAGEGLTVSVRATGLADLARVTASIDYDPELLEFVGAARGELFVGVAAEPLLAVTPLPTEKRVLVALETDRIGKPATNGELFNLRFQARAVGAVELQPSEALCSDSRGKVYTPLLSGLSVTIGE